MTPSITETLLQLADRCEKATGPDRELDTAIQLGRGYSLRQPEGSSRYATVRWHDERGNCISWLETAGDFPPRYTASLDAAMTLVLEGHTWSLFDGGWAGVERRGATLDGDETIATATRCGATPALALCAAALRARAADRATQ
jgi:hypothetical protein